MHTRENIALFDDFLNGKLSVEEVNAFEERLIEDYKFRGAFTDYKALYEQIREGAEYDSLSASLSKIHNDLFPTKKIFYLQGKFWYISGAAAGIALLIFFINPFSTSNRDGQTAEVMEYHELTSVEESAAIDEGSEGGSDLGVNDDVLIEEADLCDSMITPVKKRPIGTCFMISSNGYFLTSKHLVNKKNVFVAQHKGSGQTFELKTVYRDSLLDFAILKCHEKIAGEFKNVPFEFFRDDLSLGDVVFTLGYPKTDIVYTKGDVSSETGFRSDSNYIEISMASNSGLSGAPLFTESGDFVGIITANNSKKQSVTYVLKHDYILEKLNMLEAQDSMNFEIQSNRGKKFRKTPDLIKHLRPYIFELH